jgi:hypothetical protein
VSYTDNLAGILDLAVLALMAELDLTPKARPAPCHHARPRTAVIAAHPIHALDRQPTEAALPVWSQPEVVVGLSKPMAEAIVRETGNKQPLASQSADPLMKGMIGRDIKIFRSY